MSAKSAIGRPRLVLLGVLLLSGIAAAQEPEVLPPFRETAPPVAAPKSPERPAPAPARSSTEAAPERPVPARPRPAPPRGSVEAPIDEVLLETTSPRVPDLRGSPGPGQGALGAAPSAPSLTPRSTVPVRERDAIDRLLDRHGGITAFEALGRFRVDRRLEGLDRQGESVFVHRFSQSLDAGRARADEIAWTDDLHFGHSGSRAWCRSAGVDRPDREARSREELEHWGLLARFPFVFGDRVRFELESEQRVVLLGRSYVRLRLRERGLAETPSFGPDAAPPSPEQRRFDIYLEATDGTPLLMEIEVRGERLRVLFEDFRPVPGTSAIVPMRRVLLGPDLESPRTAIRWERVEMLRD